MQVMLPETIRQLRRDKNLTQEQLAEVLGVAVGTVSKWESGSSTPDLSLIMELADFFGVSVDLLLGYRQQSATLADTLARLRALRSAHAYDEGRREAEKAAKRFPNDFDVAYQGAALLQMAALEEKDAADARRAEQLYTRALALFDQNTDPALSRAGIRNRLADLALDLGETERGVRLLEQNNIEGINDAQLGRTLAQMPGRRGEARDHLENALLRLIPQLFALGVGFLNAADADSPAEAADARAVTLLICQFCEGLRQPGAPAALDKSLAVLRAACALMSERMGQAAQAEADLRQAAALAQGYDAARPQALRLRFIHSDKLRQAGAFDDLGPTACGGVEELLRENAAQHPRLLPLWAELCAETSGR